MKKIIILFTIVLLAPRFAQAQGTITYLSNIGQPSTGSLSVGSDSWQAALFKTGNNVGGYTLDSIQLGLTGATGEPSGFTVAIYSAIIFAGATPGSSLGALDGSLSPMTGGIYAYAPDSTLTLSPSTDYFIVLTSATTVANGAYEWSLAGTYSYNPSENWGAGTVWNSTDGSHWSGNGYPNPLFAISATPVPEPGVLSLLGLGGAGFLWRRRQAKTGR